MAQKHFKGVVTHAFVNKKNLYSSNPAGEPCLKRVQVFPLEG